MEQVKLTKRYASMDLLRSIAILLVVLAHTILSYGAPMSLAPLQLGGIGVDLFFVLSGWLLGGLLFKEIKKTGGINLKKFWYRRWMRTLPAYVVVLLFSISQMYLTKENVSFPFNYFLFLQNYSSLPFFYVSWSLCVEEQFYILIALLLLFMAKKSESKISIILIFLLLTPSFFRFFSIYGTLEETHVRVDGCVAGVFLAHVYHNLPSFWEKLTKYSTFVSTVTLIIFVFFFVARYFPQIGINKPDGLVLALIFSSWVVYANKCPAIRESLYIPGSYYIATRSYSLYLLHPEMLAFLGKHFTHLNFIIYFILALTGSLMLAEILYRLVERPIMNAREQYQVSKSE